MAQRRVNLPFVGMILGLIVVAGCALLVLKVVLRKSPKQLWELSKVERTQGDQGLRRAAEDLGHAAALAPHDTAIRLDYAQVLRRLYEASGDENLRAASNQQYQDVLKEDPTNKDALSAMLEANVELLGSVGRDPRISTGIQDAAEHALRASPDEPRYAADPKAREDVTSLRRRAEAYRHIAVIAAWWANIVTPEAVLNQHIKGLEEMLQADLAANDPTRFNPDVPYYLGLAYSKQATELRTLGGDEAARDAAAKKEKLAYDTFDQVVRKDPDDPVMAVRFYQVLRALSAGENDDVVHGDRPDYVTRMYELLSHARDVVKPQAKDSSIADDVYLSYASFLDRNRERLVKDGKVNRDALPQSIAVIQELHDLRPDDQDARLAYARALAAAPGKRDEAIAMLQKEVVDRGDKNPLRVRNRRELELQTYAALLDFLLDAAAQSAGGGGGDAARHDAYVKQIDDAFQKLLDRDRTNGRLLTSYYKGAIALMTKPGAQGGIDAIQELERARDLRKQVLGGQAGPDYRLESMLAEAYRRTNQTESYRRELGVMVESWPQQVQARKMLAQSLMADGHADQAAEQVKEIARIEGPAAKDDKDLIRLQAAMLVANPKAIDPQQIEKELAGMPEGTPAEVRNKVQVSLYQQKVDEAIRLVEKMRQPTPPWPGPADVETVRTLVQLYMSQGKKAQALQVADEALAQKPDELALKVVRAQLDGDVKKVIELTEKGISEIKDPVQRELTFFDYYRGQGKAKEAEQHLDAAQKADPENARVLDVRFQQALIGQKYDAADALLPKLAEKNFDEAHGLIYRFRLAWARGDLKAADRVVQEMTETLPQYARTWVYAGQLLQRQGKFPEATEKYTQALTRQGGNLDALRGLIVCYMAMQPPRQDDAWTYIQQGRQLYRNDPWFKEQEVAWELAYSPDKAIAPREAEAKANPDKLGPQIALAAAYLELGKQQQQKGKLDDAKASMTKAHDGLAAAIARWPEESELEYAYFADVCAATGDFAGGERALKAFDASAKFKDSVHPPMMLAGYYERAGKAAEAEAAYKEALDRSHGAADVRSKVSHFYASQGKFDQAILALDANSTDRAMQEQLLTTYIAAGHFTDADKLITKLLAATPKDAALLVNQGVLRMQEGKYPEALASLAAAREVDPKNSGAFYYQGLIHLSQGPDHYTDAVRDFTAARDDADPGNIAMQVQARGALADALRRHGQQDDAITELTTAVQMVPDNKLLRMRLIEMLSTLIDPRWSEVESNIHQAQQMPAFKGDPDWYRAEASMWVQRHQDAKALGVIRQAMEMTSRQLGPADPTLVKLRMLPLFQDYLSILARMEKYPDVVAETTDLLKDPRLAENAWWLYQMRAAALARQGKKQEAMPDYEKALGITARIHSDDGTVQTIQSLADTIGADEAIRHLEEQAKSGEDHWRITMVELYLRKGDSARAASKADQLVADADGGKLNGKGPDGRDRDDRANAYGVAGMTYMTTGQYDKAASTYEKLLALVPEDTVALNNLACIWVDFHQPTDPQKALKYSTRAVEIVQRAGVSAPDLLDTHGWALTCSGRVDEGIGFLQQALERKQMLEARYHLGQALLKKNLGPEAQVQLAQAQKLIEERKHKGQPVDKKLEDNVAAAMTKAKAMANGSSAGT